MKRMPISFTAEQHERLLRQAAVRHMSVASLVREAVDRAYSEELTRRRELHQRSMSVVGAFRDIEGKTDVAERHDDYLAEAYWADLERNRPR